MKTYQNVLNRPLSDWEKHGYNPIHLFGDYYFLRNYSKKVYRFSAYKLVKIRRVKHENISGYA